MSTSLSSLAQLPATRNLATDAAVANDSSKPDSPKALQDRFLTMLVAQMRNQDPLNPLDNSQVTSQLAQINTVNGIQQLNDTMSLLAGNFSNLQLMQGSNMIGHSVMVPGSTLNLKNSLGAAGFSLDQPADNVQVEVRNAAGQLMQRVDLGSKPAGVNGFTWDGITDQNTQAPDGKYSVKIKAMQGSAEIAATTLSLGQVVSLTPSASGLQMTVGGLGQFGLSDIKQMI
ncbi:MAG: flagellar hook assembly protein FlgD [Burkholderiaceae bacterium]|nr:MAG: flagellar hook assembly protein FlgD [Burkholderiaceae bacterium]